MFDIVWVVVDGLVVLNNTNLLSIDGFENLELLGTIPPQYNHISGSSLCAIVSGMMWAVSYGRRMLVLVGMCGH